MESLPLFGRTAEKVRILMRASKSRIKKCGLGCFSARAASVMMNSASKTILEWRVLVWRAKMCRKTVSLKDYIIDMQSAAVKGSAQYEVVLENNTDFIIKRRTATTDRELVILVSKGLYYIKDCKTGHIEELKEQSLNTFLRELKDGMVALHEVHWLSNLYRESVGLIMQVITDETLTDMCRHNVLVNTFDPTWYTPVLEAEQQTLYQTLQYVSQYGGSKEIPGEHSGHLLDRGAVRSQ